MRSIIRAVRVEEIIVSGSSAGIGNIRYSELGDAKPLRSFQLPLAKPLFHNISQYPTVNELVFILSAPKSNFNTEGGTSVYYLPPINIYNHPNHNAMPSALTIMEKERNLETGLFGHFEENPNIRPLQPYEGDVIVEGRHGNSIRFGSTITGSHKQPPWSEELDGGRARGRPIIVIRNGQGNLTREEFQQLGSNIHGLEDINKDHSSIYLCSHQRIPNFQKAGIGFKNHEPSYKHML